MSQLLSGIFNSKQSPPSPAPAPSPSIPASYFYSSYYYDNYVDYNPCNDLIAR